MNNPFSLIDARLDKIEELLVELKQVATVEPRKSEEDLPMTVKQAAQFLGVAQQTIYQNINKIPHRKRFGRLYFKRSELMSYLESGRS